MTFGEAIEHLKHGALIRRKGEDSLWFWHGKNGVCYYGTKRDYPLHFKESWTGSEVFADDWETKEGGTK